MSESAILLFVFFLFFFINSSSTSLQRNYFSFLRVFAILHRFSHIIITYLDPISILFFHFLFPFSNMAFLFSTSSLPILTFYLFPSSLEFFSLPFLRRHPILTFHLCSHFLPIISHHARLSSDSRTVSSANEMATGSMNRPLLPAFSRLTFGPRKWMQRLLQKRCCF